MTVIAMLAYLAVVVSTICLLLPAANLTVHFVLPATLPSAAWASTPPFPLSSSVVLPCPRPAFLFSLQTSSCPYVIVPYLPAAKLLQRPGNATTPVLQAFTQDARHHERFVLVQTQHESNPFCAVNRRPPSSEGHVSLTGGCLPSSEAHVTSTGGRPALSEDCGSLTAGPPPLANMFILFYFIPTVRVSFHNSAGGGVEAKAPIAVDAQVSLFSDACPAAASPAVPLIDQGVTTRHQHGGDFDATATVEWTPVHGSRPQSAQLRDDSRCTDTLTDEPPTAIPTQLSPSPSLLSFEMAMLLVAALFTHWVCIERVAKANAKRLLHAGVWVWLATHIWFMVHTIERFALLFVGAGNTFLAWLPLMGGLVVYLALPDEVFNRASELSTLTIGVIIALTGASYLWRWRLRGWFMRLGRSADPQAPRGNDSDYPIVVRLPWRKLVTWWNLEYVLGLPGFLVLGVTAWVVWQCLDRFLTHQLAWHKWDGYDPHCVIARSRREALLRYLWPRYGPVLGRPGATGDWLATLFTPYGGYSLSQAWRYGHIENGTRASLYWIALSLIDRPYDVPLWLTLVTQSWRWWRMGRDIHGPKFQHYLLQWRWSSLLRPGPPGHAQLATQYAGDCLCRMLERVPLALTALDHWPQTAALIFVMLLPQAAAATLDPVPSVPAPTVNVTANSTNSSATSTEPAELATLAARAARFATSALGVLFYWIATIGSTAVSWSFPLIQSYSLGYSHIAFALVAPLVILTIYWRGVVAIARWLEPRGGQSHASAWWAFELIVATIRERLPQKRIFVYLGHMIRATLWIAYSVLNVWSVPGYAIIWVAKTGFILIADVLWGDLPADQHVTRESVAARNNPHPEQHRHHVPSPPRRGLFQDAAGDRQPSEPRDGHQSASVPDTDWTTPDRPMWSPAASNRNQESPRAPQPEPDRHDHGVDCGVLWTSLSMAERDAFEFGCLAEAPTWSHKDVERFFKQVTRQLADRLGNKKPSLTAIKKPPSGEETETDQTIIKLLEYLDSLNKSIKIVASERPDITTRHMRHLWESYLARHCHQQWDPLRRRIKELPTFTDFLREALVLLGIDVNDSARCWSCLRRCTRVVSIKGGPPSVGADGADLTRGVKETDPHLFVIRFQLLHRALFASRITAGGTTREFEDHSLELLLLNAQLPGAIAYVRTHVAKRGRPSFDEVVALVLKFLQLTPAELDANITTECRTEGLLQDFFKTESIRTLLLGLTGTANTPMGDEKDNAVARLFHRVYQGQRGKTAVNALQSVLRTKLLKHLERGYSLVQGGAGGTYASFAPSDNASTHFLSSDSEPDEADDQERYSQQRDLEQEAAWQRFTDGTPTFAQTKRYPSTKKGTTRSTLRPEGAKPPATPFNVNNDNNAPPPSTHTAPAAAPATTPGNPPPEQRANPDFGSGSRSDNATNRPSPILPLDHELKAKLARDKGARNLEECWRCGRRSASATKKHGNPDREPTCQGSRQCPEYGRSGDNEVRWDLLAFARQPEIFFPHGQDPRHVLRPNERTIVTQWLKRHGRTAGYLTSAVFLNHLQVNEPDSDPEMDELDNDDGGDGGDDKTSASLRGSSDGSQQSSLEDVAADAPDQTATSLDPRETYLFTIFSHLLDVLVALGESIDCVDSGVASFLSDALPGTTDATVGHPAWIAEPRIAVPGAATMTTIPGSLVDSAGGTTMIAASAAAAAGLSVRPYQGPRLTWGTSSDVNVLGLVDLEWSPPGMVDLEHPNAPIRRYRLDSVVVVTDTSLPPNIPMLLGVTTIKSMGLVPDLGGRAAYFKPTPGAPLSRAYPWCPLHSIEPIDLHQRSLPIHMLNNRTIEPGDITQLDCYVYVPYGSRPPDNQTVLVEGRDPNSSDCVPHFHLYTPDAQYTLGRALPIDSNPHLSRLQRFALRLEVVNFGTRAIRLLADERIANTSTLDVDQLIRRQALRSTHEQHIASHFANGFEPGTPVPEAMSEIAKLIEALCNLAHLAEAQRGQAAGSATEQPTKASPVDDGLDDVESVAMPETQPEVEVLRDMLAALTNFLQTRTDLTGEQRLQGLLLLMRHVPVFRYVLRPPEQLLTEPARLRIKPDAPAQFVRQYPVAQAKVEAAQRLAQDFLRQGIVSPVQSSWNAPVLLVPKKDGTWRFAVDYRRLNEFTEMDPAPLQQSRTILAELGGNEFFTCCDLLSSFWQQPLHPDDRHYTAFSMPGVGQLQWHVVPMGMRNSSATQQRIMDYLLQGLQRTWCFVDDVCVGGRNWEDHLINVDLFWRRLEEAGLALKFSKCELFRREAHFLGYRISQEGTRTDPRITDKIEAFPLPQSLSALRSFLGMANFYRDFIPRFADIAWPLINLTSQKRFKPIQPDSPEDLAFRSLKRALASSDVLAFPDFERPFHVATDASDVGLGAVLYQLDDGGRARPIQFLSRTLLGAEKNYTVTEREGLAIVTAVGRFRHFLLGRCFTLVTDHAALKHIFGAWAAPATDNNGALKHGPRLTRWALQLAAYDFIVSHVAGTRLKVPDYLSRNPTDASTDVGGESIRATAHPWMGAWDARSAAAQAVEEPLIAMARNTHQIFLSGWYRGWEAIQKRERTELSPTLVHRLQRADPVLAAILDHLDPANQLTEEHTRNRLLSIYNASRPANHPAKGLPPNWLGASLDQFFRGYGNVLYRRGSSNGPVQLVVPNELRLFMLEFKHAETMHAGVDRTTETLLRHYWWPGIRGEVQGYVATCEVCQRVKPSRHRWTYGLTQPLNLVYRPFERLSIDLLQLPTSADGYAYVLVMVDQATRYCELVPLVSKDSAVIAEELYTRIYQRYGPIHTIASDGGTEFLGPVVQELYKAMGSHHVIGSPYHPQSNSVVERLNSTLLQYLRVMSEGKPSDWPHYLGACAYVYNTTHQTAIGTSPYMLMYGRMPGDAIDQWIDEALGVHQEPLPIDDWLYRLDTARFYAQENVRQMQERNAARRDQNRIDPARIQIGDFVHWKPADFNMRDHKLTLKGKEMVMRVLRLNGNQATLGYPADPQRTQLANVGDLTVLPSSTPYLEVNLYDALHGILSAQRTRPRPTPNLEPPALAAAEVPFDDKGKEEAEPDLPSAPKTQRALNEREPETSVSIGASPMTPRFEAGGVASAMQPVTPIINPVVVPMIVSPVPTALPATMVESTPVVRVGSADSQQRGYGPRMDRIISATKSAGRWKVEVGYENLPDEQSSWHWLDDLTNTNKLVMFRDWQVRSKRGRSAIDKNQLRSRHRVGSEHSRPTASATPAHTLSKPERPVKTSVTAKTVAAPPMRRTRARIIDRPNEIVDQFRALDEVDKRGNKGRPKIRDE